VRERESVCVCVCLCVCVCSCVFLCALSRKMLPKKVCERKRERDCVFIVFLLCVH